jgi:hypothetical protein
MSYQIGTCWTPSVLLKLGRFVRPWAHMLDSTFEGCIHGERLGAWL